MRIAAILVVLLGLGLFSGLALFSQHAEADLLLAPPPVPTVTVPSVTVPVPPVTTATTPAVTTPSPPPLPPPPPTPVTVPSVTTPAVSTPRLTTPVSTTPTPSASVPSVTTPQVSVGGGTSSTGTASTPQGGGSAAGVSAGTGGSGSGAGVPFSSPSGAATGGIGGTTGSIAGGTAGPSAVASLHTSRPWIGTKGSKQRRGTTLTFVMRHRAKVIFTVQQVSPACRTIGRFVVHARKGVNRVRFTGRVHGRQLVPGTYFLEARTASGRVVQRVTVVVVDGSAPKPGELEALRTANVCAATSAFDRASPFTTSPFFTGAFGNGGSANLGGASRAVKPDTQLSGLGAGSSSTGRALASAVERTARAIQPALVALLAAAILLLGLASLPQAGIPGARVNYVLARHRVELAVLGTSALVAVVISFLIA